MNQMHRSEFSVNLLTWWKVNKRNFPWRETSDPYRILIAEVLLHRTRAAQVSPVYEKVVSHYHDINELASAKPQEIILMLNPLGLKWRARLMIEMARTISTQFSGKIPLERDELEALPGISHYIAAALRSFALNLPESILDTNTVRIVSRVFGVNVTDASRRNKKFQMMYESLMNEKRPREFNFAMLDLAALVCKSARPLCAECPVRSMCEYCRSMNR